jgi:hypothetical protein
VDWIVDPFALGHELEDLSEVFANPNVVKARSISLRPDRRLTHRSPCMVPIATSSGFSKLQFLSRKYVRHLPRLEGARFARHGLAALLEMYFDISADKRYQLAV